MTRKNRQAPRATERPVQDGLSPVSGSPIPTFSTPLRFLMVTAISVFVSEALIMVVLSVFPKSGVLVTAILDATLILICTLPALYFWLYRPLLRSSSERLEAKAVLRESEEKFKVLVESINAIPWRFDLKANQFTYIGHQVEKILGFPVDSWTDIDSWSDRIHVEDRQAAVDYCMYSTGRGEDHDFEYRCVTPSGEVIWLRDIVTVRKDKEGTPFELVGYMIDITERRQAEEGLRESEEKLRSIVSSSPDAITVLDLNGVIISCNERAAEIHGYTSRDELTGLNAWSLFHPDWVSIAEDNLKLAFEKGAVRNIELVLLRKDGSSFPAEMSVGVIMNAQNQPESLIGITKDISERKLADDRLRDSERRSRAWLENSPVCTKVVDLDFNLQFMSSAGIKALKIDDVTQLYGKPYPFSFYPDSFRIPMTKNLEIAKDTGDIITQEASVVDVEGNELWYHSTIVPVNDDEGRIDYLLVLSIETTDRKQNEKALKESEANLAQAQRVAHVGSWDWDPVSGEINWSDEVFRMHGYEPQECKPTIDVVVDRIHPDDIDRVRKVVEYAAQNGEPYKIDYRISLPDGHTRTVTSIAKVKMNERGGQKLYFGTIQDITEHKQYEQALQESERRLSSHLQNTPIAAIEWNLDFEVLEWNAAAEQVFGYTKDEAIGRHASDLLIPESVRDHVNRVWNGLLSNIGGFHSTNKNSTKDGRIIVCDWNNTPLLDDSGKVIGVASLVQDITERRLAAKQLKESVTRYKHLFDSMIDGFALHEIICDESGKPVDYRFLSVNPAFERLTGLAAADVVGKRAYEELPGLEPFWAEKYGGVALTGEAIHFDNYSAPLNKHFEITAYRPAAGQFACIFVDITERKRAEKALTESEETFRSIAERINDVIMMIDVKGEITYVSPSVEPAFGYSPEELVGKKVLDILPESEVQREQEVIGRCIAGDTVDGHLSELVRKDGSVASIEVDAVPIFKDGEITGVQGILRDITETKRLQELESRAQRLETAGTIAGQVAHDFNNLLAPLMAYPDFIREELPGNHPALAYLDDIERSAKNIAEINQQLLTLGRRGHYNKETLDLNAVVRHAVKEMESLPATLICEMELAEDLMNITGGSAQIHRVISNLLHNAKDAMRDIGQIMIRTENYYVDDVSVAYGRVPKGEYVKLTMSDTGCGIPDDIVQKIFDPFFTTKTSNKKRGSGLGMSVVDAVIRDHNGYVDLSTKVGEGTSFYLYIPITRESVDSQDSDTIGGGSETILIVDDDDVQREVTSRLLKKLGYEVDAVECGEKAIGFLGENPRNLVILDMIMPGGIDGTETYRRILQISPHQKAIILSGFSESDRVFEVQKLGAGAFVRKPVTKDVIAAAVRLELDRARESVRTLS